MNYLNKLSAKNTLLRRIILAVLVLVTFFVQNTGGLFPAPFGVHAVLLVPLTVCIAMFEREFAGLFYGLAAGAMLDAFSASSICFHAVMLTIFGFTAGALITYLMRNNLVCAFILSGVGVLIYNSLYFLLYVISPNEIHSQLIVYLRYYVGSAVYTVLFTPLYYLLVRAVTKAFKPRGIEP